MRASSFMLIIAVASATFSVIAIVGLSITKPWLMLTWIPLGFILWLAHLRSERRMRPVREQHAVLASRMLAEQRAARANLQQAIEGQRDEASRAHTDHILRGIMPQDLTGK